MEDKKPLLQLEKHSDTYKLVIPADVEKKIRHLCNRISNVEWSGVLFFTCEGSYEKNNLEIRCVDILLMDIGSTSYTEFDMSPDVIAYMASHPELIDCQMGLIHSHNNMNTFFSGTDINTLCEEGNDRNHFVSLIVNNAGTYTAAITRRLRIKEAVNTIYTYKTFDDLEKEGKKSMVVEKEIIVYNMLTVVKEGEVTEPFQEIDERLAVIQENKERGKAMAKQSSSTALYQVGRLSDNEVGASTHQFEQPSLFDNRFFNNESTRLYSTSEQESLDSSNPDIFISASKVKSLTLQLLTGSVAISDASKIDPQKWVTQMVSLFNRRFGENMQLYNEWIETFAGFIIWNSIPEEYSYSEEEYVSELCSAVYLTLKKLPSNKYIEAIKITLKSWMN